VLCLPASALAADPTGDFTISPQVGLIGATFTFTPNVTPADPADQVTITWGYGDGTSGSAASHSYTSRGNKTVTMTAVATNNGVQVGSLTTSNTLRVNAPPFAEFSFSPNVAQVGGAFSFTSSSSDPEGPLQSQIWNFGDGTGASGPSASHTYNGPGTRTVTLTVTDSDGVSRSVSHNVRTNAPPVARFNFAVPFPNLLPGEPFNIPVLNNPVAFSGNASNDPDGTIVSYAWDLDGNGVFDNQSSASFVQPLTTPGMVNVGLKVTDNDGATAQTVVPIRVDQLPVPSFTFSPTSPVAGQRVDLASTSTDPDGAGDIAALNWDLTGSGKFADASGGNLSVVFPAAGSYSVGLQATDTAGIMIHTYRTVSVRVASSGSGSGSSSSGGSSPFKIAIVSDSGSSLTAANAASSRLSVLAGVRVAVAGRVSRSFTKITKLVVAAPPGARVTGRCRGGGCHVKSESHRAGQSGSVRLRRFERTYRVGTRIVISITKSGQIGKQIVFTTRSGQAPARRELCLKPGTKHAQKCPA
jgi:PKD repeat protein